MDQIEKYQAALKRVEARYAVLDGLSAALEGLPVSIKESGSLKFGENVTDSQFNEIARTVSVCAANSTTLYNFAKGDLWCESVKRYGGGKELMIELYGVEAADTQAVAWKNCASIARKVPIQDRDITRSWRYYRDRYNNPEGRTIISEYSRSTKYNVEAAVVSRDISVTWEEHCGKKHNETFPMQPIKDAILGSLFDSSDLDA